MSYASDDRPARRVAGSLPWDGARPGAVLVVCSDGRWRPHLQRFATEHLASDPRFDIVAVPGGIEPLALGEGHEDFAFLRRRLDLLVAAHATDRLIAVAHQECAWYRHRPVDPVAGDARARQTQDLRRAAEVVRALYPKVAVETWFACRRDDGTDAVVFEEVGAV